jgi:YHS domain-containing protein
MPTLHPRLRSFLLAASAAALVALGGCSAMQAQNPGQALSPVNAQPGEDGQSLMLGGHDVVAYFTQGRHALGQAQFNSQHQGVTFRFASAEHKALFDAAPARYVPQYGGYCANGIGYGIPWGGNADVWRIVDGRLYIFGGAGSRAAFELDLPANIALADRYWRDEIAGRNSFVQRGKRLVFRVPHYKSDAELAAAVRAAGAAAPAGTVR